MPTLEEREAIHKRDNVLVLTSLWRVPRTYENLVRAAKYRAYYGDLLAVLLEVELVDIYCVGLDYPCLVGVLGPLQSPVQVGGDLKGLSVEQYRGFLLLVSPDI